MVMITVRELFSANSVIPFIFNSFYPGGDEDCAWVAYRLFFAGWALPSNTAVSESEWVWVET
jgi:hypothetical protein